MIFKFLFGGGREEGKEREGWKDRERYRETRQSEANEDNSRLNRHKNISIK